MKFYTATIKALSILFGVLAFNLAWAGGGDPFSVKVTEKTSTHSGSGSEVCLSYSINEFLNSAPKFEVSRGGVASPTFNVEVNYAGIFPVNGTMLELRVKVYRYSSTGIHLITPMNNTSGQNYTTGSTGSTLNGKVDLTVSPIFSAPACIYYFKFEVIDVTPNSLGMSYSILNSPGIGLAKDKSYCTSPIGFECIEEEDSDTHKLGINNDTPTLSIYPNPVNANKALLSIELPDHQKQEVEIRILDIQGKLLRRILSETDPTQSFLQTRLDLTDFSAGIYVVEVESKNFRLHKKVIKN